MAHCIRLIAAGVNARAYHAGLSIDVRTEVQEWFMHGDSTADATASSDTTDTTSDSTDAQASSEWPADARVVVGTIAFGMVSTVTLLSNTVMICQRWMSTSQHCGMQTV
jgi:superfamily II helicase